MKAFVKENTWLSRSIMDFGWGNGYVVIPSGHPLNGIDYDEIHSKIPSLQVHGGLTFSKCVDDLDWDVIPENSEGGWVVGFDTCHCDDTLDMWSKKSVKLEALRLKQQLEAYTG